MAKRTRAEYLQYAGRADSEALATLASGENPDGTDFTLPTAGGDLSVDGTPVTEADRMPVRQVALNADVDRVSLASDARAGTLKSIEITLSATPGTVTVVTVADTVRGFRLYPRSNNCRFSVDEAPAAVATVAAGDQVVAAADFAVGGIAKADQWETRLLDSGTSRTVQLRSLTASVVVDMEVF